MLFFARTDEAGDIEDYLLLMRTIGDDFDDTIFLEVNEEQYSGSEIIREARMSENMLTLFFSEPVAVFGGETELVIAFSDSPENRASMEAGAFRVLGEKIAGGNA
jgi:hypothetical protein